MTAEWYYARGKERVGPLTGDQLKQLVRSGGLARNDMVWKAGMAKWTVAGQVKGLFDDGPSQAIQTAAPPPLPETAEAAVEAVALVGSAPARQPHELKYPVIGMFAVTGLALLLGIIGVLQADRPVVRVLMAVGLAHNIAAVILTVNIVRLRNYGPASLAPWVVMTCWVWYWFTNPTHGMTLLGMVLAASAGLWGFFALRGKGVRRAFEAEPPLPPLFLAGNQAAPYELDPGTRFPWPLAERQTPNLKLRLGNGAILGVAGLAVLLLCTDAAILGVWLFGVLILFSVFWIRVLLGLFLRGRWVPADGHQGWIEFLPGNTVRREDGTVGTYTLLPNQKFIDIHVSGRLVDSWKILSWGDKTLKIQDMAGQTRSLRKGKTLEEKQASFFDTDRSHLLHRKWEPVTGDGPAIQLTDDGTMIRFDGFAARYTFSGEEPHEVITIHIDDTQQVRLKVLSLNRDEMVLAGEGGTCHYRRGVSITDAESQRRAEAAKERMKAIGKAALLTVGAIGAGIAVLGVAAAAAGGGGPAGAGTGVPSEPCKGCGMLLPKTVADHHCPYCGKSFPFSFG